MLVVLESTHRIYNDRCPLVEYADGVIVDVRTVERSKLVFCPNKISSLHSNTLKDENRYVMLKIKFVP